MESSRGRVEGAAAYQYRRLLNLVPKQPRGLVARMPIPIEVDYDRDCYKYVVLGLDSRCKFSPSIYILGGWTYVSVSQDALERMYSRMETLPARLRESAEHEECETIIGKRVEIVVRCRKSPSSAVKTVITIRSMIEENCESRITLCSDDVEELNRMKNYIFHCLKTLHKYSRPLVADQVRELVYYLDAQLTRRGASRKPSNVKKMISFIKKVKFDMNMLIPKHEANYVPELMKFAIRFIANRLLIISSWSSQVKLYDHIRLQRRYMHNLRKELALRRRRNPDLFINYRKGLPVIETKIK